MPASWKRQKQCKNMFQLNIFLWECEEKNFYATLGLETYKKK